MYSDKKLSNEITQTEKDTNAEVKEEINVSSVLTSDKSIYDFGDIDIFGGKVTTEFILTNTGTEDIIILNGVTSCGCTEAEIDGILFGMHEGMSNEVVVKAGDTIPMKVIYDPLAHGPSGVGLAQRSVFLKTNSSATPELEVRIKAMVTKKE